MSRVLWLSTETPDREGQGGQRRQFHQIRALLSMGHQIHVVVPRSQQDDARIREITSVERPRLVSVRRVSRQRMKALHGTISAGSWDAVVVSHTEAMWLLPDPKKLLAPVLLDMHNVMSRWHSASGRNDDARAEHIREADAIARAAAVTTCSVEELQRLRDRHPQADGKSFVAPLGVDPAEWPDVVLTRDEPIVAMFGSWGWSPNALGLRWFTREVWPRVRARVPGAVAQIAGSGVPAAATDVPGVVAVGRVERLAEFTAAATVVAVPVLEGVGAAVKFAESLATGAAVIATPDGANAFETSPAYVSADAEEWAAWIAERLDRRTEEPAPNPARSYALETLTWSRAVRPIDEWLRTHE